MQSKLDLSCGLISTLSRRTFDILLKSIFQILTKDITIEYLFVTEFMVIVGDDRSLYTTVYSIRIKAHYNCILIGIKLPNDVLHYNYKIEKIKAKMI